MRIFHGASIHGIFQKRESSGGNNERTNQSPSEENIGRKFRITRMKSLTQTTGNIDDIKGVTLEERARLVLLTLGKTPDEIRKAYRRLAKRHHPDKAGGSSLKFKAINEAYQLLAKGQISTRPLLADDELVMAITGRCVKPLLNMQKEWEEYERWHRQRFYGMGVV